MKTLDLHSVKHHYVEEKVSKFLNWAELPCRIVTGKSKKMKTLVLAIVTKYGYDWDFESAHNFGSYIIKIPMPDQPE